MKFEKAEDAISFISGGSAVFTIESKRTGKRYTYRARKPNGQGESIFIGGQGEIIFIDFLTGPDNTSDYVYLGFIKTGFQIDCGNKGNPHHPAFAALDWLLICLRSNRMPATAEMWHEGRCGRCGRRLTTPESIKSGFGHECVKKVVAA